MADYRDEKRMSPLAFTQATGRDDTWGIINWARDGNRAVWDACPGAREPMLIAAAFARWEAYYQALDAAHWISLARWISENLDAVTGESDS